MYNGTTVLMDLCQWLTGIIFPDLLVLWYIFCRVFIVVESFIMLVHIPDQALQVPTWAAYIPHIV